MNENKHLFIKNRQHQVIRSSRAKVFRDDDQYLLLLTLHGGFRYLSEFSINFMTHILTQIKNKILKNRDIQLFSNHQ